MAADIQRQLATPSQRSNHYPLIHGLVKERSNSSALAMELRFSCTNPTLLKATWTINDVIDELAQKKNYMTPVRDSSAQTNW